MQTDEKGFPQIFQSAELTDLIGIDPIFLNKCIEREQYGIGASVRAGKGRGKRRLFSEEDLWGVALIWCLFESGLRTKTIQFVLNQICGGHRDSGASDAARILLDRKTKMLVIEREPRRAKVVAAHPAQRVFLFDEAQAERLVRDDSKAIVLVIPIGNLFLSVRKAIDAFRRG